MAKATLEFDMYEDKEALDMALSAMDAFSRLHEVAELCRKWLKHGHTFKEVEYAVEEIQNVIYQDNLMEKFV